MVTQRSLFFALALAAFAPACAASSRDMAPSAAYHGGGSHAPARAEAPGAPPTDVDEVAPTEAPAPPPPPPPPPGQMPAPKLAQNDPALRAGEAKPDVRAPLETRAPILIYTASLNLAVFEVANTLSQVEGLARDAGGYLSKKTDRQIVIRVPAARFHDVVARIEKLGDLTGRDVVAQDVTEEYLDVEVRLKNARAMRDRLEQLLAKANNVQDSLAIEKELTRVAGEIERMEGRLKFLRDRAAFSTITVTFAPKRSEGNPPTAVRLPFPWLNTLGLSRLLSL